MSKGKYELYDMHFLVPKTWRNEAFVKLGSKCVFCGGVDKVWVRHILPVNEYPVFADSKENAAAICGECRKWVKQNKSPDQLTKILLNITKSSLKYPPEEISKEEYDSFCNEKIQQWTEKREKEAAEEKMLDEVKRTQGLVGHIRAKWEIQNPSPKESKYNVQLPLEEEIEEEYELF
ncbi:MAG: hypothetical protein UV64_C0007G0053 [Parcubacteria group bacterium GW2011_GWC1_43_11b]|nr:MAG: hypothetical protein UV64_C0007G0053 [Parcubacteria group bacterium GW2011_GWC1_43_11b]